MRIYFDHNAGAPLRPVAREAMMQFLASGSPGNPASVHFSGQRARKLLEQARTEIASLVGAAPRNLVFTSGGTEANNLAIFGTLQNTSRRRIVTSTIEHSSILAPIAELKRRGCEIVRMPVDREGKLLADRALEMIDEKTALISLGLANSEVGTIQDLSEFAHAAHRAGANFHIDAAQAAGRIPLTVQALGCDLMTISSHKSGGPAGIGALYIRPGCNLAAQLLGGPQEVAMRSGTPNLSGAIGFGAAAQAAIAGWPHESARVAALSQTLLQRLQDSISGIRLNGPREGRLKNTLNLTFPAVLGETLLIALDLEGVEMSMGSACAAGAVEPSHVLIAMGRSVLEARSSVRLSLGWSTTLEDVERAAEIITRVWRRLAGADVAPLVIDNRLEQCQ